MPQKQKKKKQGAAKRSYGLRELIIVAGAAVLVGAGMLLYLQLSLRAPELPEPSMKQLAGAHDVGLGMLVQPKHLDRKPFRDVLTSQYSLLTTDGEMHWDSFRPAPDKYDWDDVDRLVDFADRNGMAVEGHHLVWDEEDAQPKWLKQGNHSRDELRDIMRTHIQAVAGRYKGRIDAWSVVNEPFSRAQGVFGLDDWWGDRLDDDPKGGTAYIDDAFIWARQADPDATLILNDFFNETATGVANAQYDYVKSAKARGIPVDAVGMQMHIDAAYPPKKADMVWNMKRFAALGTPVYITEFDINSSKVKGSDEYKAQLEARVAADVVRACVESQNCASFTVFGMTDVEGLPRFYAYNRKRSYLLTDRYQMKPVYHGFREAWFPR